MPIYLTDMATTQRKKLAQFAKEQGISYITAYRAWHLGRLDGIQLPSGTILVAGWRVEEEETATDNLNVIIYARVNNSSQNRELKQQVTKLTKFAEEKGYNIIDVVEEIGFGFSDHRTKLLSILYRNDWNTLLVDRRESFASFGFTYFEALLRRNYQEIIVASDFEDNGTEVTDVPLTSEQHLINLMQRTRAALKTLIGMGSVKTAIETSISGILK